MMSLSHCKDEEAKPQGIVTYLSQVAEGLLILRPGFKNNKEEGKEKGGGRVGKEGRGREMKEKKKEQLSVKV